jgi:hypothetical protein
MSKPLPQKINPEERSGSKNPDPFAFVEVEGDDGPEFLPIGTVLAESAMRQAESAERIAGALERLVEVLSQAHGVPFRAFGSEDPEAGEMPASKDPQP